MKLKSLTLKNFRGATNDIVIPFDSSKRITMIFGENGTGKSTIVDAFSFICEQNIGSLQDRSTVDKECIVAITGKKSDLLTILTADNDIWEANFKEESMQIIVTPETNIPKVNILRRSNILRLIESEPSKRYDALSTYIDLPGILKSETALRTTIKSIDDKFNNTTKNYSEASKNLEELWVGENKPPGSAEEWAAKENNNNLEEIHENIKILDKTLNNLSKLISCILFSSIFADSKALVNSANSLISLIRMDSDLIKFSFMVVCSQTGHANKSSCLFI